MKQPALNCKALTNGLPSKLSKLLLYFNPTCHSSENNKNLKPKKRKVNDNVSFHQKVYILILGFCISIAESLTAQNHSITFSEKEWGYNPVNSVLVGVKDDHGFVWFGTSDGFVRWDGLQAKIYRHDQNDPHSIQTSMIHSAGLFWNKEEQTIWVPTEEALSIFDPVTECFTNYISDPNNPKSLPDNGISVILQDRQGVIWLGTENGIAKYTGNKNDRTFESYNKDAMGAFNFGYVLDIDQDARNDSILWLGTMNGELIKFNKYEYSAIKYLENGNKALNTIRGVISHQNGLIFLKGWSDGLSAVFDPKSGTIKKDFRKTPLPEPFYRSQSIRLKAIGKNEKRIWHNTKSGLYLIDPDNLEFEYIKKKIGNAGRILPLVPLFEEEGKQIWFGTDEGFFKESIDPYLIENYFYKFSESNNNSSHLTPQSKGLLFNDGSKFLLPVKDEKGLYLFDLKSKKLDFIIDPIAAIPEFNVVRDFLKINEYNILLVSESGLYKVNIEEKKFIEIKLKQKISLRKIIKGSNEEYWALCSQNGLFSININTGALDKINLGKGERTGKYVFKTILRDKKNNIWVDYDLGQYGVYLTGHNQFILFNGDSLGNFRPSSFAEDKNGIIWVGNYYDKGADIGFIDPEKPELGIQLEPWLSNILFDPKVRDIEFDDNERLWAITGKGLEVIDFKTKTCKLFNESHGLVQYDEYLYRNPFYEGKLSKLPNGEMAIIYKGGIGIFYSDNLFNYENEEEVIPYITSIKIAGLDAKLDSSSVFKKSLVLEFDNNNISFDYSILCQNDNEPFSFFHRLVGMDKNWVNSEKRIASYTDLPSGQYSFEIKVERGNKEISTPFSFSLKILPPWYRTIWAWSLWVSLTLATFYAIYRFQITRKLAQSEALHFKELDTVKSRLYTNITHEFRTPLTVILGMAEQLKLEIMKLGNWELGTGNSGGKMVEGPIPPSLHFSFSYTELIKRNGQQLLHLVNQLLDLSKLESGHMPLHYVHGDVVAFIKYLAESFHSFADSKDIRLHFLSEIVELPMDYDPEKLQNIVSNLLSNAIKFTPAGGDIYLGVKKESALKLLLTIRDTGVGIREKELPHIFDRFYQGGASSGISTQSAYTTFQSGTGIGLSLCKELVKLMGGDISAESTFNIGSKFTIGLPIRHAYEGKVLGEKIPDISIVSATILPDVLDAPAPIGDAANSKRPLVLLVEDNPDVITYLISLLSANYEILTAMDGQSGIVQAIEQIPDLIVSDVMMPQKDGFEVCETLKLDERTSHIPIILLTAKSDQSSKIEGLAHGADAYLAKPFHKEELLVRIEKLIEGRRQLQQRFAGQGAFLEITKTKAPTSDELFLQKLIGIVEAHLSDENFGMPELCKQAAMSRTQLFRKLKALTGKSATRFIRTIRLEKAKHLLTMTDIAVSVVAYETGFGSAAYFARVFQEEFGMPPSEVRQ